MASAPQVADGHHEIIDRFLRRPECCSHGIRVDDGFDAVLLGMRQEGSQVIVWLALKLGPAGGRPFPCIPWSVRKKTRESAARSKDERDRDSAGNRAARPCFALRTRDFSSLLPDALGRKCSG